jgi:organic radical activating enzyme
LSSHHQDGHLSDPPLGQVSPTFCLVKWKHASVNLASKNIKTCCHNLYRPHQTHHKNQSLLFHDHPEDQKIRQQLLLGQKPSECSYCWRNEDLGGSSDRLLWSHSEFMSDHFDEVVGDLRVQPHSPSWLEINLSPICQLKCSYCSPELSTSWKQELDRHGNYVTRMKDTLNYLEANGRSPYNKTKEERQDFKQQFWGWFEQNYAGLRVLTLTGGEPFLSPEMNHILQFIKKNPNPKLQVSINSNISFEEKFWAQCMDQLEDLVRSGCVKQVLIHPSIDTWGKQAEYIRFGLNLNDFEKNIHAFAQRGIGDLVFNCTLNNLSPFSLLGLWQFMAELKRHYPNVYVSIDNNPLVAPEMQSLDLLPAQYASYMDETISFAESSGVFSEKEILGLYRAKKLIEADVLSKKIKKYLMSDFYSFFNEYDRRKGTDFLTTFPELQEFWQQCEKIYKKGQRFYHLRRQTKGVIDQIRATWLG